MASTYRNPERNVILADNLPHDAIAIDHSLVIIKPFLFLT